MVTYTATLDVDREAVLFVPCLLAATRRSRRTRKRTRALTCFRQAGRVLRHFRDGTDPATLARDNGIGRSTRYRHIDEAIQALADQAPDAHHTMNNAQEAGVPHLVSTAR